MLYKYCNADTYYLHTPETVCVDDTLPVVKKGSVVNGSYQTTAVEN